LERHSLAIPFEMSSPVTETSVSARGYTVEVVERWQTLESQVAEWDELADHALEPNHFYSAAAVLAAMRHLQPPGDPAFLVVRSAGSESSGAPPRWCGFFPLLRFRRYRGAPVRNLRLLAHDYCFLRVPLVRADCTAEVLRAVFAWLDASDCALVELADQTGEGAYAQALSTLLRERGAWQARSHTRALLRCGDAAEDYIRDAVSSRKLKELRRQERRLAERGELRFESLSPGGDIAPAIDEFLQLERAGWKGSEGTAISCRQAHAAFFAELVQQTSRAQRLRVITLRLGGRPIAMKCNFLTPPGAFAFKIAYAEELSQYSPGVLLELENIRRVHAEPGIEWMDSCAAPGHPMIERLWKEQRSIHTWLVPLNGWGRVLTITLSWLQRIAHGLPRWRAPR
jgi:CelD/BcsL family acetyltransferase involved in cellulose biosynthesis